MVTFRQIHRHLDHSLKYYIQSPRRSYQSMPYEVWEYLLNRNQDCLYACNAEARIAFARIAVEVFASMRIEDLGPFYLVTFSPADGVFPIGEASEFDVARLKGRVRQALGNIPGFGMVEAALYKKWGLDGPSPVDHVSWHVHFIVWGATRDDIAKAVKPLRESHENMFARTSVNVREIKDGDLERVLLYILKGQIKEYRVERAPGEDVDETNGVVTFNTQQRKRWIQTGNAVRMATVLHERRLPDLVFGNGDGTWLAKMIRHEAWKPFCRWADKENRSLPKSQQYPEVLRNRALGQDLARHKSLIGKLFPKTRTVLCPQSLPWRLST